MCRLLASCIIGPHLPAQQLSNGLTTSTLICHPLAVRFPGAAADQAILELLESTVGLMVREYGAGCPYAELAKVSNRFLVEYSYQVQ